MPVWYVVVCGGARTAHRKPASVVTNGKQTVEGDPAIDFYW